ncbi:microfibril-associated glycoprotein 4-like [Armigeres subalbatus]|uniref:microfibril-associated glycoprotein 4-like n=1 Tax=Armigeres subalbatus TaxID=124917 RepID=UPI002ED53F23
MMIRGKFVFVLYVLQVFCCNESLQSSEVANETVTAGCAVTKEGSFGYELLLTKLEDLESKFWNMWIEMKEQNEQLMRNHSRLEETHQGVIWMLTRFEQDVGHNLSTVMGRSWEILQQQLSCSNHENWKQSMLSMAADKSLLNCLKRIPTVPKPYKSCAEAPAEVSGKYLIHPSGFDKSFEAYCEQDFNEGGWLVIQYRFDGSVDFNRNWTEYKNGFGSPDGEMWIGLETLHRLTKAGRYKLMVQLRDFDDKYYYAQYDEFGIGSENESYALRKLGTYSGSAGDSLDYHRNMKFSTLDRDNDAHSKSCAQKFKGAWWFNDCYYSNLNAIYKDGTGETYMNWYHIKQSHIGLKYSRMMIRQM